MMKSSFILGAILISVISVNGSPANREVVGLESAFDEFILYRIDEFINNSKDPILSLPDSDFNVSQPTNNATGRTTGVTIRNVLSFNASVTSSISALSLSIGVKFPVLYTAGNYSLNGVSNSVIIVKGQGNFAVEALDVEWEALNATLLVNPNGYASINNLTFIRKENSSRLNSTFDGIEEADLIGEIIKVYLQEVGSTIYQPIELRVASDLQTKLQNHLNAALQTITLDEILYGPTEQSSTPTTAVSSTTTEMPSSVQTIQTSAPTIEPTSGTTSKPDLVVDIGADLSESGWTIPSLTDCGYATNINGFFCSGSPVVVRDPHQGIGFWMSPCTGKCIFHYDNENGARINTLGIRAYYNDNTNGSKIVVTVEHSSGTTILEYTKKDGEFNSVDLTTFGLLKHVNVTMENNGPGVFSVLDSLSMTYR